MTVIPLRCHHCGTVEDLITVMEIAPGRFRLGIVAPKQPCILDPERVANCRRHGEIWCWACWSAQWPGEIPHRYDLGTGKRVERGESPRGGHA
jgi:hypothetical protein